MNLSSLNIIENILPQYKQKQRHVSGWCQKKHLHCIISRCPRTAFSEHLESKCLYIPKTSIRIFLFQRGRKLLSGGGLNNFLSADHCLRLVKCFIICHFKFLEIQLFSSIS